MAIKRPLLGSVLQGSGRGTHKYWYDLDHTVGHHEQLCMLVNVGDEGPSPASDVRCHS